MTIMERICGIILIVLLIGDKAVEMLYSFDMTINPIETIVKIAVMIVMTIILIERHLLPRAEAC